MSTRNIVVVGASAGGVEALMKLVANLPADLNAAIFVVLHISPSSESALPQILARSGPLPSTHARDGERFEPGHIYVAPPDYHLLVDRGRIGVIRGPEVNGHRPAVDPLFRSAARSYGPRVVGIILSGTRDDGTAGLAEIKQHGGLAIVQALDDALYPGMPRNALENVAVDYCEPATAIGPLLSTLTSQSVPDTNEEGAQPMTDPNHELKLAGLDINENGLATRFTCPLCHGSLAEIKQAGIIGYRCRVGHTFSPESLLEEQAEALESALWTALNALGERSSMARRVVARARENGHSQTADRFEQIADDADRHAVVIQRVLLNGTELEPEIPEDESLLRS